MAWKTWGFLSVLAISDHRYKCNERLPMALIPGGISTLYSAKEYY